VSILNSPEISQAYFFPQDVPCNDAIEVDVGDAILRCHHHVGNDDGRTLVHFHGNGEAVGHYTQDGFIPTLSARMNQINVLMVEYRGYGGSSGEVEMVSMLPDGQRALEQLNIDPAKTIAYGRSIGSLYALELANRCPELAGLVIDSGVANIEERFLARKDIAEQIQDWDEVNKQVELHFNHQAKIESYDGKVLLLHAAKDGLINLTHADRLYQWATNAEIRKYTLFMQGDHNSIFPVNEDSILLHLHYLERDLFGDSSGNENLKLRDVPMTGHAFDRGAMLDEENDLTSKEGTDGSAGSEAKPHLFAKLRNFFSRR
jgi:pimeloyl-ACP methyl ester carboxylesterase